MDDALAELGGETIEPNPGSGHAGQPEFVNAENAVRQATATNPSSCTARRWLSACKKTPWCRHFSLCRLPKRTTLHICTAATGESHVVVGSGAHRGDHVRGVIRVPGGRSLANVGRPLAGRADLTSRNRSAIVVRIMPRSMQGKHLLPCARV